MSHAILATLVVLCSTLAGAADPAALGVLGGDYPRAYFFRQAESMARRPKITYEEWDACFSRLGGIEGKTLREEIPQTPPRNSEWFSRFKRQHPEQLVMLHFNGNSRDPRFEAEKFFAGHWIYINGTRIAADVPAEPDECDIAVADPSLFQVEMGRYRTSNEDVGLCLVDAQGRPDWRHSEQVQLVSIDAKRKTIRVRRGCYGTQPMRLPAGSYAAAHASEGPWGAASNLLWYYNFSTHCPRDAQGRTCSDVLADDLAARFRPGGELAAFDGLEFDVLSNGPPQSRIRAKRGLDTDADGQADQGWVDGTNAYGIGVVEFCRKLRQEMGRDRLILADGMSVNNQRAFGILNGIESEGWPHLSDWEVRDWSGGLNRHGYWRRFAAAPVFNYINHKFVTHGDKPGHEVAPDVPFHIHRLVFAAGMFTDSAICYAYAPQPEPGEPLGIWDELRKGTEQQLGWLGQPRGPAVRLAEKCGDAISAWNAPAGKEFLSHLSGTDVRFSVDQGQCKIDLSVAQPPPAVSGESAQPRAAVPPSGMGTKGIRFRVAKIPVAGPDLFVSVTMRGATLPGYPKEMPRLAWVGLLPPGVVCVEPDPPEAGMAVRGKPETALDPASGAAVRYMPSQKLGGQTHQAYLVHPPYLNAKGYTFWTRDALAPAAAKLRFFTGMGEKAPGRSDGVLFRVEVAELGNGKPLSFRKVFEHTQVAAEWIGQEVSLADWAGKQVRLKFVSDCGPKDHAVTDHSLWGDVILADADTPAGPVETARHMGWAGAETFTSTFYFSSAAGRNADLEFQIEGGEPVWIASLAVHAHPDAMYRAFERGLVLANPSPRPYTFDLDRIAAGRKLRRLRGSSRQDSETNNGQPVSGRLTLGPKDALFLTAP